MRWNNHANPCVPRGQRWHIFFVAAHVGADHRAKRPADKFNDYHQHAQ
jgi:hypothetical protein